MEPTAKSTKFLHIAILILLCIPVVWSIGLKIYYFDTYANNSFIYWFILRMFISALFIFMVFKKMYGILLYLIAASIFGLITTIIQLVRYPSLDVFSWVFFGLNLIKLVLMIILLHREHHRFFNLRFASTPIGYPITYKRIRNMNVVLSLLLLATFLSVLIFVSDEPLVYFNGYTALFALLLLFTIIGIASNSKFQLLAFMIGLIFIDDVFESSQSLIIMAFPGNWSGGWDQIGMMIGVIVIIFLLTFGLLIFFILRSYLSEKKSPEEFQIEKTDLLD